MERTMEEKVKRLKELNYYDTMYQPWLLAAKQSKTWENFINRYVNPHDKERLAHARIVWDVHTGVAFTKLYKALK